MEQSRWEQRRVSISGRTLRWPRALLGFALADLVWEIIKSNLGADVREGWPWRFTLLDASTCAAIVALLTGIVLTRSQLSQTMRPVLSWSAAAGNSGELDNSRRTVRLINAGGGRSVVHSVAYQVQVSAQCPESAALRSGWMTWRATVDSLASLDLARGEDFFLLHLGRGAAIPMTSTGRDGMEILALGPRAMERLAVLDVRIQVEDVLGDIHERQLQCVRPAASSSRPSGP
ncbi:hypothetical protein [Streptomyces sp. NBC_00525]|uniref:hypothetical protein n=1 Tax=Streptomyces sp. NBC_00525 TaxID=2903660 RepID=UPI002E818D06|nr:hypothetical protein [Streptomyces sp. NBC_00525]WUC92167.1 hypothetical protein OG710_00445 [Streptomyces sp. NBC_00525]